LKSAKLEQNAVKIYSENWILKLTTIQALVYNWLCQKFLCIWDLHNKLDEVLPNFSQDFALIALLQKFIIRDLPLDSCVFHS